MTTLVFLDIETTGLDFEKDHILEIYAQPVDSESLAPTQSAFHCIVGCTLLDFADRANEYVANMHSKTGLIDLISGGVPIENALLQFKEWLQEVDGSSIMLAGRNVGTFDRRFLEAKMPGCTSAASYKHLDVSSVLRAFDFWGSSIGPSIPEDPDDKHRAQADVEHDIECMRVVADWIDNIE